MADILVVDDSPIARGVLVRTLRIARDGDTIREATDGAAALALCRERAPEILISDLRMPGMDGRALLDALMGDPALAHIAVVIVTSSATEMLRQELTTAGARSVLAKPFPPELLAMIIGRLTGQGFGSRQDRRAVVLPPAEELDHDT